MAWLSKNLEQTKYCSSPKEYSYKMTPNDILFYSWISVSLSHHQGSFLLQKIGAQMENCNWAMYKE